MVENKIEKAERTEIVQNENNETGLAALGNQDTAQDRINASLARLELVHRYVDTNFTEGVHFGQADQRCDKPVLLKAGAEAVCGLFSRVSFRRDDETWEVFRDTNEGKKTICYICELIDTATGAVIGEGRGAETLGAKQRDINKTIKIAQKNALVDAALRTFHLSGKFTQDLPAKISELKNAKRLLLEEISDARAGLDSELTDARFIQEAVKSYLHRKDLPTIGAINKIRRAIFVDQVIDLHTGEMIKDE